MKRILSVFLSLAMVLPMLTPAAAAQSESKPTDVSVSSAEETEQTAESQTPPEDLMIESLALPARSVSVSTDESAAFASQPETEEPAAASSTDDSVYTYKVLNGTFCEINGYTGSESEITVPAEIGGYIVQAITNGVFENNKTLSKVTIPDSVERLGSSLFRGCTSLTEVSFPAHVTVIPAATFFGCTSLTSFTFWEGLTEIGSEAFRGCTSLTGIELSTSVKSVGNNAFEGCTSLTSFKSGAGLRSIGDRAFINCGKLETLDLCEGLTTIYAYAFEACKSLTEVTLPDSVTTIAANAFLNCTALTSVSLPKSWSKVLNRYNENNGNYIATPFTGCSLLSEITIPEGMTTIPAHAFRDQTSLQKVTFSQTVETVGAYAFDGCSVLSDVSMNEELKTLNGYAFRDCTSLSEVVVTAETMNGYAFEGCTALKKVTLSEEMTTFGEYTFGGCSLLEEITIPAGVKSLSRGLFSGCSSLSKVSLPEGLTTIYAYTFEACKALAEITLPDSVTTMSANAFLNCNALTSVSLPKSWNKVLNRYDENNGNYVTTPFAGCSLLTEIAIPEGVTAIPAYAFRDQNALKKVTFPETVETVGAYAFENCTSLIDVQMGDGVKTINTCAFHGCTSLKEIELSESLTVLANDVFHSDSSLREITIPAGVTVLNGGTFHGCTGLTKVTLPEGLTTIYAYAFENCSGLTSITLPDSITTMSGNAFLNCTSLANVNIPKNLTKVLNRYNENSGNYTVTPFAGCKALISVTIPEGMTALPAYLFRDQPALRTVILPETMESIGAYVFAGATSLREIWIGEQVTAIGNEAFANCPSLTIHGAEGSYAKEYAESHSIAFSNEKFTLSYVIVSGKITDKDGNGLSGVSVSAYDLSEKLAGTPVLTGEDGSWSLTLTAGHSYTIRYYSGDYAFDPQTVSVDLTESGYTADTAIGRKRTLSYVRPAESEFTYKVLNGTFCELVSYTGNETAVILPDSLNGYTVKSIAANAFKNNKTLVGVMLPATAVTLGSGAFYGCTALTEVGFGDLLTEIGSDAFRGCTALTNIELSTSVKSVGNNAFEGCTSLTSFKSGAGLRSIGDRAFINCGKLENLNLCEGLTTIYAYAFEACKSLSEIDLPDSVTTIAANAFLNCTALTSVSLPKNWSKVLNRYNENNGNYIATPFTGCTLLTEITIPEGMTTIPAHAFRDQTSLQKVTFPQTVETVGSYAFAGCTALTDVSMNEGLKQLNDYAFRDCTSLSEVMLTAETLNGYAFEGCTALKKVTLSEEMTAFGEYVFGGCSLLEEITIPAGVKSLSRGLFSGCSSLSKVSLPEGLSTIYAYAFEACKALIEIDIPDSVTTLSANAFLNCTALTSVSLPKSWNKVLNRYDENNGNYVTTPFAGCSSLTEIAIPEGVTAIPAYAFRDQNALKKVTFPETVETVGAYAFENCTSLIDVRMGDGVKTINTCAFHGCTSLKEIELSESLTVLAGDAFHSDSSLREITIPAGVTVLNGGTFHGCTGLTKVTLPEGLSTIYAYAFENCSGLTSLTLPDSITTLSGNAFLNCTSLANVNIPKSLTKVLNIYNENSSYNMTTPFAGCKAMISIIIPEGMTAIPAHTFRNQTALRTVILPETMESIGAYAFAGCSALDTLTLPKSLKKVGDYAFYGCIGLRLLNFNEELTEIGQNAFANCAGLLSLVLNEKLVTIGNGAFSGCSNLTAASIPKSVTSIGSNSFASCPKITLYCYSGTAAHYAAENGGHDLYLLDDHEHAYESTLETSPTCTRGGSQILTCSICSYHYIEVLEPLGHGEVSVHELQKVSCTKNGLSETVCTVCGETIARETTPAWGHDYGDHIIAPTCTTQGYTLHGCSRCEDHYKDTYVPAVGHDFGEWTIEYEPTVFSEGKEMRLCRRDGCGEKETRPMPKLQINIAETDAYGLVHFSVVNAKTKEPIPNAMIFISTEDGGEGTLCTDENGMLSQVLPVGPTSVSVYAEEYLARNLTITVHAGEQTLPLIGISTEPLVDAKITSTEMTYQEIIDAGIDPNAEGNGHVYKYAITFVFTPEIDVLSLVAYFNIGGSFLGFGPSSPPPGPDGPGGETGPGSEGEETYILHYHLNEGGAMYNWSHGWCKDVEVEKGETVYLNYRPFRDNADEYIFDAWYEDPEYTKKISTVTIKERKTTVYGRWISKEDKKPDPKHLNFSYSTKLSDETEVEIYPVSERFYLIIYGEAKWLKEMYNVQLVAINNSATDTVEDCIAELSLPYGLSLADMVNGEQSLVKEIGHLGEAGSEDSTKTVNWYVRGDIEGEYDVTARLSGKLMPFGDTFSYDYTAAAPIKVYAGSALHMDISAPGVTYYNDYYPVTITLTNVSHKPIYNLTHTITGIRQYRITTYSDGHEERKDFMNMGTVGTITEPIFNPGDRMVIELQINILFESELIDYQIGKLTGMVDGIENLLRGFKCFKEGAEKISDLGSFLKNAGKSIDGILKDTDVTDTDKSKAYSKLASAVSSLMSKIQKGDSKALAAYDKLKKTGMLEKIEGMADSEAFYAAHTAAEILKIVDSLTAVTDSEEESGEFDIFDSIRTAIEAIPVQFVLRSYSVTTLGGSTTQIPYSFHIGGGADSPRYFGVDSVSKYIYSLVIAGMGEVDVPWYFNILGVEDDPTGYEEAVEYIQMTEEQIAAIAAKSATGMTLFKAWVEKAPQQTYRLARTLTGEPEGEEKTEQTSSDAFELSCNNETAYVDENGVLHFTGGGFIEILPKTTEGGILYVEMTEGGETRTDSFVLNVVDAHDCAGSKWQTVLPPEGETVGYQALRCDLCDDLIEVKEITLCTEHIFGSFTVEKEYDANGYGLESRSCAVCGTSEYRLITTSTVLTPKEDSGLVSDGEYVSGVRGGLTVSELKALFDNEEMTVLDASGEPMSEDAAVSTGCQIRLTVAGELADELVIAVRGDTDGNGQVNVLDLLTVFNHIEQRITLDGAYRKAASLTDGSMITVFDLTALMTLLLGSEPLAE